jgi:hypothetical protein
VIPLSLRHEATSEGATNYLRAPSGLLRFSCADPGAAQSRLPLATFCRALGAGWVVLTPSISFKLRAPIPVDADH